MYRLTRTKICDNSGVLGVKILQFYPTFRKQGFFGLTSLVTLFKYKKLKKVTKKKLYFVLLTTVRGKYYRPAGAYFIRFFQNTALLLTPDKEKFVGTTFSVPLTKELKHQTAIRLLRVSNVLI